MINNNIEWIAEPKNTIVVQMGDQVDSLNRDESIPDWEVLEDIEVLYFTDLLDKMALSKGGRFISIVGNHEFMNVIGNFSYVSKKSLNNDLVKRHNLFKPKGTLSPILCKRPIILKIGDLLFCHAGLTQDHINLLKKYNKDISYINKIWRNFVLHSNVLKEDKELFDKILLDFEGILWTRNLNSPKELKSMINNLGCSFMFVGHTVMNGVKLYENSVWYTDTGISRAFGTNNYQYLEIVGHQIYIKEIK